MVVERINIGCSLPHGYVLEIGLPKKTGVPAKDYRFAILQGLSGARKGAKFGSALVPKDLWDEWLAKNAKLRYVVDQSIFVIGK